MKLSRGADVAIEGAGLVCRQSRLGGLLLAVLYTVLFAGLPVVGWWYRGPTILLVIGVLLAAVVVPFLWADVRSRFRDTNWVLAIRPSSLLINLRSYQDGNPPDAVSIIELDDRDIAELRRRVERYTVPDSDGGSTSCKLESLDIELRDAHPPELTTAINELHRRPQPETALLGVLKGRRNVTLYSVSTPTPRSIRIAWYGEGGHAVRPRLARVLDALAQRVKIGEPARQRSANWQDVSDAEFDDRILELVCAGNRLDAIKLLVQRRGYSMTDAHRFVEELTARADLSGRAS